MANDKHALLRANLKQLRLPTMAAEFEKLAREAATAIAAMDSGFWRSFNLVLADRDGGVFVRGLGHGHPDVVCVAPGVHMVTAHDPDDPDSPRVARHLARFQAAVPPTPDN